MKKLNLVNLKVKSFVTMLDKEKQGANIFGGYDHDPTHSVYTQNHYCAANSLDGTCAAQV